MIQAQDPTRVKGFARKIYIPSNEKIDLLAWRSEYRYNLFIGSSHFIFPIPKETPLQAFLDKLQTILAIEVTILGILFFALILLGLVALCSVEVRDNIASAIRKLRSKNKFEEIDE